jgi:hypothetical protein
VQTQRYAAVRLVVRFDNDFDAGLRLEQLHGAKEVRIDDIDTFYDAIAQALSLRACSGRKCRRTDQPGRQNDRTGTQACGETAIAHILALLKSLTHSQR